MCECCGGDCRLIEKQPLNEAYSNEILEAYQLISNTFDDFTQLMRSRIPFAQWPDHCRVPGIMVELLRTDPSPSLNLEHEEDSKVIQEIPILNFSDIVTNHSNKIVQDLKESLRYGWQNVQSSCRPDESFRAMIDVMAKWLDYIESNKIENSQIKPPVLGTEFIFPQATLLRIQAIGRAEERLRDILYDDVFDSTSKHNTYWHSKYELESEKLDHLRRKVAYLSERLWDLLSILENKEA